MQKKLKIFILLLLISNIFLLFSCQSTDPNPEETALVISYINEIPNEITYQDSYLIEEAYQAYQLLAKQSKKHVSNYDKLEKALNDWETLVNFSYNITYQLNGHSSILPSFPLTYTYLDNVILPFPTSNDARFFGWYNDYLFQDSKITTIPLNSFGDKTIYAKWLPNIMTPIYNLGNEVWETKKDLETSYYTDFYNFILTKDGGSKKLTDNNINNLNDFLILATDYYGGGTDQMRGIGNLASSYYLEIIPSTDPLDNLLENQSPDYFIGYCYQNNMYMEFIPFMMEFFAYWRTDEGYTTPTNRGNDFFASAWAALVDTSKFFYYTATTSYVKTTRVADCFNNIPGVINYKLDKTIDLSSDYHLPLALSRKDYLFVGWYTDSLYNGNPVTVIPTSYEEEIYLYARWQKI